MKREIAIPPPSIRFPEAGWRERIEGYARQAASAGLELEVHLEPGATEAALRAAPGVQGALRELVLGANGGRIGHVHLLAANAIASSSFASDYVGTYQFMGGRTHRPPMVPPTAEFMGGEPHEVVLACRDGTDEHRFTTLGTFLESALVRAWAEALHRKAESDAGDDLDDRPWIDAARALELRIDPKMIRTRED